MSAADRQELRILLSKKYSLRDIAPVLGRAISSLSEEIKRNSVGGNYDPVKAQHKAYVRRKYSKYQGMKIVEHSRLRQLVEAKLYDDQSPGNIAGRVRTKEKHLPDISKDSIYRYVRSVYGRKIEAYRERRRRRRARRRTPLTSLKDRVFIDQRPKQINTRKRVGDAEADFVTSGRGGRGIILAVVDRKTRVTFLRQIIKVTIPNVHRAFQKIKRRFPELKTITTDNDVLFKHHQELERLLRVKIYFCHPYHAWEKGTIENANKYLRRDIPKGSDISKYSKNFICQTEDKLNRRIMECLNYQTPSESLSKFRQRKTRRNGAK